MSFQISGKLRYFQFASLTRFPLTQAIFTRKGGISPPPWDSLNIGGTVGDQPERVRVNKTKMLDALDKTQASCYEVWQVHGSKVVRAERPLATPAELIKSDAVITDQVGVTLVMRFADCVPIFLYDPDHHAIGLVHAGWLGSVRHVANSAVQAMNETYGSRPERILAGIGPSIGPDHYQVGEDVISALKETYRDTSSMLVEEDDDLVKLDLWKTNQVDLHEAGVRSVENSRICTACNLEDWYSHRAENGNTGRFGAVFALEERT